MSADILRRAATLMRERAETVDQQDYTRRIVAKVGRRTPAGQHIASMHPAVALAVADWLVMASLEYPENPEALAVARAYLGDQS